jgi:mycothiol system anti-sigma-R factor
MSKFCGKSAAQVYSFIDRELTAYRRFRIRVHLRRCPPCADGYRFEQHLKDRIRRGCHEDPPPDLVERLHAFLQQHGASDDRG